MIVPSNRRCRGYVLRCFLVGLLFLCLSAVGQAETVTYTQTVRQPFSGNQSPDDARAAAIAKVKREVLEKAGTYLDSIQVVRDHQLVHDQVTALSAAVLKAEIVSQKNYVNGETFGIEIEARVSVDPATLEERIKSFLKDQSALAKAEKLEKREKELLARVRELEARSASLASAEKAVGGRGSSKGKMSQEYSEIIGMLSAIDANRKALDLWDRVKFVNPSLALSYLNEAIRKDNRFAEAFNNRGIAYADLGKWRNAINDYDSAIRLEPDFSDAFNNRGMAYANLGETEKAIKDFDQAVQGNPGFARAYCNRGTAYITQGHSRPALENFDKAIELDPGDAVAYHNRGNIFSIRGVFEKAIKDYDRAIEIDPDDATFYFNRGVAYKKLNEAARAKNDLDKAAQLAPREYSASRKRVPAAFKPKQYRAAIKNDKTGMQIDSQPPNAEVFVNGEFRGTTPLQVWNLPPGKHRIKIAKVEGHKDYFAEIELLPRQTWKQTITLKKNDERMMPVQVRIEPTTAKIYLDDCYIGESPAEFLAPVGKHRLKLVPSLNSKYEIVEKELLVADNQLNVVAVRLKTK